MDREKLIKQLFVGKVTEIIGTERTIEMLKEATAAIDEMLKSRKADVSGSLPDEVMIKTLSSRYMHSNRTIGGGDAGWIEAAYKDGMRDLVKMLKGN